MPSIKCRDVGFDCPFEVQEDDREVLMEKISAHARDVHGIEEIHPIILDKINKATRY